MKREPFNRPNLKKLLAYLTIGKMAARFHMAAYTEFWEDPWGVQAQAQTCGTCGCAVGHGPYAGIPKLATEDWHTYSRRVFTDDGAIWDYLFSASWAHRDNTVRGARKRIKHILTWGEPPDGLEI